MKRSSEYKAECSRMVGVLQKAGANLERDIIDYVPTGRRYSLFRGRVSAIWDVAHFKNIPFGHFKVLQ